MEASTGCSEPLGASLTKDGVNFALWSARAQHVDVCIFDDNGSERRFALPGRTGQVFHGHVSGLGVGTRYGFRVHGSWAPAQGHRFDPDKLLLDPYAFALDRPFDLNEDMTNAGDSAAVMPKAVVVAPELASPPPCVPWTNTIIYELHVRGFTKSMPGVPEPLRGTFAGLANPTAINHLLKLGITTVELLPCMAWIDEPHLKRKGLSNYWGYNPIAWCAPDPRLAPGGWAEVRQAIAELGKVGIEVILDVVYNHSGEGDELGPTVSLRGIDNASYYRLQSENCELYVNDAGTGNILDAEQPAVTRLVMDSLRAWARFAGVAGFRFDLATTLGRRRDGFDPNAPLLSAMAQDPVLRQLKMIAEPWDCGPGGYQLGQFSSPWAEWNDQFRDDVRRFWRGDALGLGQMAQRLGGSQPTFGGRPVTTSLNFVTSHDGFTLFDLVSCDAKQNEPNGEGNNDGTDQNFSWISDAPARDQRNLLATLLIARGTPMLSMGSELGQSQGGNNNAYAQDNATSWIDWSHADAGLSAFCGRLIGIRRDHPALRGEWLDGNVHDGDWPDVAWSRADGAPMDADAWDDPHGATLVATFCEGEDRVCAIVHRGYATSTITLPPIDSGKSWRVLADTADDARTGGVAVSIGVAARSVVILCEVAAPAKRTGLSETILEALSDAAGIEPFWWSVDGQKTLVPRETHLHILNALGLSCTNNADARDSLRLLAERFDRPVLPPSHVHHGSGPVAITVGDPSALWLEIEDEIGNLRQVRCAGSRDRQIKCRDGRVAAFRDVEFGEMSPGRYTVRSERGGLCRLTVAPERAFVPDRLKEKRWGLSAQLYAMRRDGDQGIGDFTTLGNLLALAKNAGAACLAINPLHALFPDNRDRASPYYPSDRRFIDPIWLDIGGNQHGTDVIDYPAVWAAKDGALRRRFAAEKHDPDFADFIKQGGSELRDFATFTAKGGDLTYPMYLQWLCEQQLAEAAKCGEGMAIGLLRDLAIGAAPDGAEAMTLSNMIAKGVSLGAPPDPFSADGQVWCIPPFKPQGLQSDGYETIAGIYRSNMRHAGALRIDHAIGLMRQFWVPNGAEGKDGAYVRFPFADLLGQLKLESQRAHCLIIGEDLGTVAEGFREQMNAAGILSYKVMPFEREGIAFRAAADYPRDALACAATHDLPPLAGWWNAAEIRERHDLELIADLDGEIEKRLGEKEELLATLAAEGLISNGDSHGPLTLEIAAAVHAFIACTPSLLAIAQVEDLAAMETPVNLPGTDRERPNWRHRLPKSVDEVVASAWAQSLLRALGTGRP